jgi:hypothetical protein
MAVAASVVALSYDVPIRDPDSVAGPTYVRLPAILAICFLTDVLPRALRRASGRSTGLWPATRAVIAERWNRERI